MPGTGKTQVDPSRRRLAWYDRGPGPAGYTLPPLLGKKDHAVTHRINPEYTMRPKPPLNLPVRRMLLMHDERCNIILTYKMKNSFRHLVQELGHI